ncbi:MAG: sporulation protein YtfJ [Clostridia bacterium]|nr:sporulation protein YtfJ [Clostridia bacterium]
MKQNKNNVGELFGITTEKIKAMVDVDSILGTPIKIEDVTIIPVSKVTYGFGSGGSDFATKNKTDLFGGGGGAGITIAPVAFIVISNGDVRIKPISTGDDPLERAITLIPDAIDKIVDLVDKFKSRKNNDTEEKEGEDTTEQE